MRLFLHQLRAEQVLFWRNREAAFFIFVFPLMLYLLLGALYGEEIDGVPSSDVLLAGLLGYGAANTSFGGLAILLVVRREAGILKRLRSTPLPAWAYLGASLVSILIVFAVQTVALFALGWAAYGASGPRNLFSLVLAVLLGAAGFAGLGLATAALIRSAEAASPVVNAVLLPMAFLSGSFGPTRDYPDVLQAIADVLPLKYFIEVVNRIYLGGGQIWDEPGAVAVVAAWGLAGVLVAARRFRWEPRER